jgi:nicotinate dehydrogenase subunit A
MVRYTLVVNSQPRNVDCSDPDEPLLYVLRNLLQLKGTKFGCGLGQCGACTVLVDGAAGRSCQVPIAAVNNRQITTIEGLGTPERPHPVQAAFIAEQAAQCGYCTSGMVVTAVALLSGDSKPSLQQVKEALADNLCRCGTHHRVLRAVMRAAERPAP